MLQESLFGRADPKRTFNVEANLLKQRNGEIERIVRSNRKRAILIAASLAASTFILPPLYAWQAGQMASHSKAAQRVDTLTKELQSLGAMRDASVPKVADSELVGTMRRQNLLFLGQTVGLLNATPSGASIQSYRTEASGGEATSRCTVEAESFSALKSMLESAGKLPNTLSTVLSSSRHSEAMGPSGVAFEFVRKAGLAP